MPRVRPGLIATLLALFLLSAIATPFATAQRGVDTYAITNARIVPVSGPTIERGTIVVRNGLIAAVGSNVSAPPDARVIDGTGTTVYPGLIDAYTNLAQPEPSPAPAGGGGGGFFQLQQAAQTRPGGPNSTQPAGLQPETMAEDVIRNSGNDIESTRTAGFTTALSIPRSGLWMGQSALINLAGESPQQMIIRSPVAMHASYTTLRGQYPGSLMGVFSALRQMMLDAQRYNESMKIYERSPKGLRRPETDRSLAALVPVIEGKMPIVMVANSEREIARALDLQNEFKLKLIIAGGREAGRITDRLVKQEVPVLLSLNLPRRTTAAIPEADPELMRVLRERVEAQQTAGKLARAKVRFGFQSGSLPQASDIMLNANRMIENGLSKEDALRAFTIWPAEILGAGSQLGSLEVGKIANLTVTRGDLFDRNGRIAHVFIDGKPVDLRPATPGPGAGFGPGAPSGAGRQNLSGLWTLNVNLGTEKTVTLNLRQEGDRLSGSLQGALGNAEISNASLGEEIRFAVVLNIDNETRDATFVGTVTGNEMRGSVTIQGRAPGTFTGTRATPN